MPDTKRTYQAETPSALPLKLRPRPTLDEGGRSLAASLMDRREFPFSREVIQRLIEKIKQK